MLEQLFNDSPSITSADEFTFAISLIKRKILDKERILQERYTIDGYTIWLEKPSGNNWK